MGDDGRRQRMLTSALQAGGEPQQRILPDARLGLDRALRVNLSPDTEGVG